MKEKMNIPLTPYVPENLVSRDGFSSSVPRQPVHVHTRAESGVYSRDSSRFPRRRPFIYLNRHTPLSQSRVYGSAYLQSMDFQREQQSKHHLYFLDCFCLSFGQPDPTRPISLTLTQTPTPADRVVPTHSWRPLGDSTVWADFVCVSGSVLYLVRTQSKK